MTADVRDRLRQLTAAHAAATPGPWRLDAKGWIDGGEYDTVIGPGNVDCMSHCYGGTSTIEGDNLPADAAAIVAAVNAVPWLVAALTAVLDLADELDDFGTGRDRDNEDDDEAQAASAAAYLRSAHRIRAVVAAAGDQP